MFRKKHHRLWNDPVRTSAKSCLPKKHETPKVGSMLAHRLRRWSNNKLTLGGILVFGACVSDPCQQQRATDYSRVASRVDITKSGILQGLCYIFFYIFIFLFLRCLESFQLDCPLGELGWCFYDVKMSFLKVKRIKISMYYYSAQVKASIIK